MAPTRRYDDSPNLAALYARTVAASLRSGGGDGEPVTLELPRVRVDAGHLANYREVTGFAPSAALPVTYPHVLAFPLHLDLMSDPSFSHRPMGIVHLANTITQHRPLPVGEEFAISVSAEPQRPHPKGTVFDVVSEVRTGGELVWLDRTTLLSRGPGSNADVDLLPDPELEPTAEWDLKSNLGRRYAAVSGDRNPIHLFKLSAQAFGFPRQIAHGMWAKAASLASIDSLPEAFTVRVDFRKPLLLPSKVSFGHRAGDFALYGDDRTHLIGRIADSG